MKFKNFFCYFFIFFFLIKSIKNSEIIDLGNEGYLEIFENKGESVKIKTKTGKIYKSEIIFLILPGGGYESYSSFEGIPVAEKFLSLGYSGAVLKYSYSKGYPIHYNQGLKSIEILSKKFKKIILIGFSAGGHLSGIIGTSERVKLYNTVGMILCYPVISFVNKPHEGSRDHFFANETENTEENRILFSVENRVNSTTLPTFIWTVRHDELVPYENTLYMIEKLKKYNIPYDYRIFEEGHHGMVFADEIIIEDGVEKLKYPEASKWLGLACDFMENIIINS